MFPRICGVLTALWWFILLRDVILSYVQVVVLHWNFGQPVYDFALIVLSVFYTGYRLFFCVSRVVERLLYESLVYGKPSSGRDGL